MNDTERFLAALDPPDPEHPTPAGHYWPDGIPTPDDEYDEHPLECQFLANGSIGNYLSSLSGDRPGGPGNGATAQPYRVDFAAVDRHWTAERFPLALCEFLAYKSGLAYRAPHKIRHDLLGLDTKGRPYKAGVHQYAFFDTSQPTSTVRYADTQAYVFVHERTGYLIFRGTSSFADWHTNLSLFLTTDTYASLGTVPQTLVGSKYPARHTGFAIAWGSVAPDIKAWVDDQMRHQRIDKIVLSGHSLGGALAILGAHYFAKERICPVHAVITFGAPKVGGPEFKAEYESPRLGLKDRTLRVEAAEDVISVLARRWSDTHVGHAWRFNKHPLRPAWQMALFSPLLEGQKRSQKKIDEIEAEEADATQAPDDNAPPSNAPAQTQRTWRQYVIALIWMALGYLLKMFVRAVAAHSVETRYGLYLSTLSYRRIRKYHKDAARLTYMQRRSQENERIIDDCAFTAANADLRRHLDIVRGRHPRTFSYLLNRPIRIETPAKLAKYEKKYVNYIA